MKSRMKSSSALARLAQLARPDLPLYLVCTLAAGLGIFVTFSTLGVLLQSVAHVAAGDTAISPWTIAGYLLVVLLLSLGSAFAGLYFSRTEQRLQLRLRSLALNAYFSAEEAEARSLDADGLLSLLTQALPACTPLFGLEMNMMVWQPMISGFCSLVLLAFYNPAISVLCVVCALGGFLSVRLAGSGLKALSRKLSLSRSDSARLLLSLLEGASEIRTFGLAGHFVQKCQQTADETSRSQCAVRTAAARQEALRSFMSDCVTVLALLLLGALLSGWGWLSFADILLALPLSDQIAQMISAYGNAKIMCSDYAANAERVFALIDLPQAAPHLSETAQAAKPGITVRHVSFAYQDRLVLDDVSFFLPPGQKVALVGASGSGKSTLFQLLLGLYPPQQGQITVQPPVPVGSEGLFAYLPQKCTAFHATVAQNIALSDQPDLDRVIRAAQQAQAASFIEQLPQGYDTLLGEKNDGLSGGQLQRLALARCLYRDAPILLADEPTSALDEATEQALLQTFLALPSRYTLLVTTHRLAMAAPFDHILVLDQGRLVEQGTHTKLLQQQGVYARLWNSQNATQQEKADECREDTTAVLSLGL